MLFAIFVWQAMFMWVVGAVYLSNCEFIPLYRCNMYRKSVCCRANLSYTDFTPSECWVILFYIYIFILIFVIKMLWWQKEKEREKKRGKEKETQLVFHSALARICRTSSFFFPPRPAHRRTVIKYKFMMVVQLQTGNKTSSTGTSHLQTLGLWSCLEKRPNSDFSFFFFSFFCPMWDRIHDSNV